jgi:hypothetical protein
MTQPDHLPATGQAWNAPAPPGSHSQVPVPSPRHVAAPGWHPDPTGVPLLRYFDGQQWTDHTAPQPPPQYHAPAMSNAVAVAVANGGGGPNHALHAVLTVLTCGMWAPIWILVAILGGRGGGTGVSITR